jgi:hypothetical protein
MSPSTWLSDVLCCFCKKGTRFFGGKRFSTLDDADHDPSQFSKKFKYRLLFLHFLNLNIVFMQLSKDGICSHKADRSTFIPFHNFVIHCSNLFHIYCENNHILPCKTCNIIDISTNSLKAGNRDGQIQKARKSTDHRMYGRGCRHAPFVYPPLFFIGVSRVLITINKE